MVSQRWQKKQALIQHVTLFLTWGLTLYWFHVNFLGWQRLILTIATWAIFLPLGYFLNKRFATTMIRVFKFEEDAVLGIVNRSLIKNYIRFNRSSRVDETHFVIRDQGLTLVVEPFPLNLPIDSFIEPITATKIEIRGLNRSNEGTAERLSKMINQTAEIRLGQA